MSTSTSVTPKRRTGRVTEVSGEIDLNKLLREMIERRSSDLHLKTGSPPMMRIDGNLYPASHTILTPDSIRAAMSSILTDKQRATFEMEKELDLGYSVRGLSRFRVNVYLQRGTWGAAFRTIPARPFTIDELKLPSILKDLAMKPRGLLLVTGPTGSGKSTTLAAVIDFINENKRCHIVTIEDPIEFLHRDKRSLISQREVGPDTNSFSEALKRALRQDPDVILVGEMRDLETTAIAISAAETGHLVLATLHTTGASSTIDRIIDQFPGHQQGQIRVQLASILEGVMSQVLMPRAKGEGRVMAMEILTVTPAVRNVIREEKVHMLVNIMQAGAIHHMKTLDMALRDLYQQGIITYEEAFSKAQDANEFNRLLGLDGDGEVEEV
ncbi:MAG: Twitching mobility protein [bacterium ADurb.Bin363]|nr:MAG: Twitching mobility protein [bacterium ADurb.Bin363]